MSNDLGDTPTRVRNWGWAPQPPTLGRESWKVKSALPSILTLAGRSGGVLQFRFGGNRQLRFNLY